MTPGKNPASAIPRRKRRALKDVSPFTKIMQAETMPQVIMILAIHLRAPNFFSKTLLGTSKKK